MATTYEYTSMSPTPYPPNLAKIEQDVAASEMSDRTIEYCVYNISSEILYVTFTNALSGPDKTILDSIVSASKVAPEASGDKSTLVDNDTFSINDSEKYGVVKTTTWSNIKSKLKTYFDSIYSALGHTHAQLHTQGTDTALGTLGTKDTPIDADKVIQRNSESADALVTSTWTQIKAFLKTYFDSLYFTITNALGKKNLHGIESIGTLSFANDTHILTIATGVTYWYQGTKKVNTGDTTCDIDSYKTLTANIVYWFYFDDTSGTLKCDDSFPNFKTQVSVACVFWNGSAGAILREYHNHTRDLDWHEFNHDTVGMKYESGLGQTNPTTVNDALLQIESGSLVDEDLHSTIPQQTTCRGIYKVSASKYTWTNYSLPYVGTSGQPKYLRTSDYTLQNVGASNFACYWVYGTQDTDRAIYIIPTHATSDHNTILLARAETPPALAGLNLNPDMKLLYRWIYKGDGNYQEVSDYRLSSPLPSGGVGGTTASAVSFNPQGDISSTTVQTAIEELDTEKAPAAKGVTNGDSHDHNGGDGAAIVEAAITLADNSTNDVSTSKHGFTPKAPNDTAKFLRGDATWAVPVAASFPSYHFSADMFENPNTSNWAVNAMADLAQDTDNTGLIVRVFDDTNEEGVGFTIPLPSTATNIKFSFRSRPTTGVASRTVGLKLYNRKIDGNGGGAISWSAGTALTDIDITNNQLWLLDTQTISFATLSLTAGALTQFQLNRVNPQGGTELVGNWILASVLVEFT